MQFLHQTKYKTQVEYLAFFPIKDHPRCLNQITDDKIARVQKLRVREREREQGNST